MFYLFSIIMFPVVDDMQLQHKSAGPRRGRREGVRRGHVEVQVGSRGAAKSEAVLSCRGWGGIRASQVLAAFQ